MTRVLRFLLLDSTGEIHSRAARAIKSLGLNFDLERVELQHDFGKMLKESHWDAIIVNGTNGKYNIDEVYERVRQVRPVPVIGIVREKEKETEFRAIKKGIHDLISLSELNELPFSLLRVLQTEKQLRTSELVENELQRQVKFLNDVFNAVQEGICVMDTKYTILQANSWYRKMFAKRGNVIGKQCFKILMGETEPCADCNLLETLEREGAKRQTISFVEDGKTKWLEVNSYPLRNSAQQIIGVIQSVKDITSQKLAELELMKLNRELDERVKQRTAQLEAANKELEAFSYSVSHDLRAPLVRIDGFSQLLLDLHAEELSDEARHYLNRIRSSVLLMSQLIDDLLDLSRVTRKSMVIRDVNLSKLAEQIIQTFREAEPHRKVNISIQPNVIAKGDIHLLTRVMDNLLNNAWKFTSKKSDAMIEFGVAKKSPVTVYFIKDNGAGFKSEYADQLFAPFKRLHSNKDFPGNGIGLATVQRIIHRHGGKIWAIGEVDKGATFYFTLQSQIANGK